MENRRVYARGLKYGVFFGSIILALILSLSSLWLSRVFFSQNTLSDITTTALAEQSSRDSIGRAVSDRVFEDRPVLKRVAGPKLSSLTSSILGTDIASSVVDDFVEQVRVALTTSQDETIAINLSGIKSTIGQVQSVVGTSEDERQIDIDAIPDEFIIVESDQLPNIYQLGVTVLWLGPVCLIYALGALAFWAYRGRRAALWLRIKYAGVVVIIASVIGMLVGPLIEPVVVSIARVAPAQTLLGNLYNGLVAPFQSYATVLFALGVLVIAAGYLLPLLQKAPALPVKTKKPRTKKKK